FVRTAALRELHTEMTRYTNPTHLEYAICLHLCETKAYFHHIPKVLATQTRLVTPDSPQTQQVIVDHLNRHGLTTPKASKSALGVRFTWGYKSPSLAIIIPSKNNARFLQTLIPALVDQPYQGEKSIYIVDNGSDDPETVRYYQEIKNHPKIKIISYPQPFNYSQAINLGVRESSSELVLLMNDDMALMDEIWLDELAQWATRPDIGVVGPKLLRKNHTIQHAGIIMGLTGFIGHIYLNAPEDYHGLLGSVNWYRNYLAVTGACQMIRRELFNEVGGYDEGFRLAFGDIDFCLRVYESGYHNVYTPFARLYHFEGSSRGYKTPVEDALRGYDAFESYLISEDPYFSPNLTYSRIPKCVLKPRTTEERRKQIQARKAFYLKNA
ncbi:MAG: glycosyltransferase family 2 protein, partial [Brevefilum sp.]